MTILEFPPHESADIDGLLAIGGDLEVDSLLLAYRNGIFPWPFDDSIIAWFSPPKRAVLFLDEFHISSSLKKELKRATYNYRFNRNFEDVLCGCAELTNRGKQKGTWITPSMKEAFLDFHRAGFAYSYECYDGEDLIAGIYGVTIGSFISAESMYYRRPNASKLALAHLVQELKSRGVSWLDCQVLNPFTESLGAREIGRDQFLNLLQPAVTS